MDVIELNICNILNIKLNSKYNYASDTPSIFERMRFPGGTK
jgi:hypothetical protein